MGPQPTRVLVLLGLVVSCAGTRHAGFAPNPADLDAERRCQQGSPAACAELGRTLIRRHATERDVERGLVLLEVACGAADQTACTDLARTYLDGNSGDSSRARARDLAGRACDGGFGPGCTVLGEAIERGPGNDGARADAFRRGCTLADARGCELYAVAVWNTGADGDHTAGEQALAAACGLGRLTCCHRLALVRLEDAKTRREGAALLMRACERGFGPSCETIALSSAPLVGSGEGDCARAAPVAEKACALEQSGACAVRDACELHGPEAAQVLERLRDACDRRVPLACLYWADAEDQRSDPGRDRERVHAAYRTACRQAQGGVVAMVACTRLAASELAGAQNAFDAESPLASLRQECERSSGEACCELAEQQRTGKWMPADADKARELRERACNLGCDRCCR